jgi:hypothetical protein
VIEERGNTSMESKPVITRTTHVLPFERLSWQDFERLCLALLLREDFTNLEHLGAVGAEGGRDIIGNRGAELWYVQCKRVAYISAQDLLQELDKMVSSPKQGKKQRPQGVLFLVSCSVSGTARDRVVARCQELGVACQIWAQTDLDARVQQHADIVREFFGLLTDSGSDSGPPDEETGNAPACVCDLSTDEENHLLPFSFMTPDDVEQELEETQRLLRDSHLRRLQVRLARGQSPEGESDESQIMELHAKLAKLTMAWSIVQKTRVPAHMLIKDFLEGNIYGAVLTLFMEPLRGDFDDLDIVQAITSEAPVYRRRLARRLVGDPDAPDAALSEVIQRNVKALVERSNSPYLQVSERRYRRIYL